MARYRAEQLSKESFNSRITIITANSKNIGKRESIDWTDWCIFLRSRTGRQNERRTTISDWHIAPVNKSKETVEGRRSTMIDQTRRWSAIRCEEVRKYSAQTYRRSTQGVRLSTENSLFDNGGRARARQWTNFPPNDDDGDMNELRSQIQRTGGLRSNLREKLTRIHCT